MLKTDLRSQFRFGNELVFYQAANIGGKNGLRGYRTERFTGQNAFVGSADLRYAFNSFKTSTLPLQFGLFIGSDTGRVWVKNDTSKKWHNDYGGGFWVSAADSRARAPAAPPTPPIAPTAGWARTEVVRRREISKASCPSQLSFTTAGGSAHSLASWSAILV